MVFEMIVLKPSMKRFENLKVFNINGVDYVLPEAAAHAIGCSVRTMRDLTGDGRLKGRKDVFGKTARPWWLIERESLKQFIEKYIADHAK